VARGFIAGLLRHSREITLVTNQWVNSYKRLVPGFEAPVRIAWNHRGSGALGSPSGSGRMPGDLLLVPEFRPGREGSARIEYRAPDAACNPYLTFAALLAAGLEGIENEYQLPPGRDATSDEAPTLPGSLYEAIQEAESSQMLRNCLGDHLFESLLTSKQIEWERYRAHVTDYELNRYLPIL
jgi:glutamine synthetase